LGDNSLTVFGCWRRNASSGLKAMVPHGGSFGLLSRGGLLPAWPPLPIWWTGGPTRGRQRLHVRLHSASSRWRAVDVGLSPLTAHESTQRPLESGASTSAPCWTRNRRFQTCPRIAALWRRCGTGREDAGFRQGGGSGTGNASYPPLEVKVDRAHWLAAFGCDQTNPTSHR
jgi:hypothetical protein